MTIRGRVQTFVAAFAFGGCATVALGADSVLLGGDSVYISIAALVAMIGIIGGGVRLLMGELRAIRGDIHTIKIQLAGEVASTSDVEALGMRLRSIELTCAREHGGHG